MKKAEKEKLAKVKAAAKKKADEIAAKKATRKKGETYADVYKKLQKEGKSEKAIAKYFQDFYKKKDPKKSKEFVNGRIEVYKKLAAKLK